MNKILKILILLLTLQGCSFEPILINKNFDFRFENINSSGDEKINQIIERSKKLAKETGLFVGISSGANILASEIWIKENKPRGAVVTMLCDRGERYFSIYEKN